MAQLTDDCFAFSGPLMPIEEVEQLIQARIKPVDEIQSVPLAACGGRVLAYDLRSPINLPSFDNSAVDGYALRHTDVPANGERVLVVAGRVAAGDRVDTDLKAEQAIRIFTGAPMPEGADTVVMQEDVRDENGKIFVPGGLARGSNVRYAGEDIARDKIALSAGTLLEPQHVALAAALGLTTVQVRRRLRVAIFSTGNEIIEPGTVHSGPVTFDANRTFLKELLARFGATVTDLGIVRDDIEALSTRLKQASLEHDLIVTSGGVSTGEADYVRNAVERVGRLVFWRVALKPGRPVAMGTINGAAFVGLPGNPVAVFVTFVRVVRPLLLRLAGAKPRPLVPLPVRVTFPYKKKAGRREYVRVTLRAAGDGAMEAIKYPQDGAGVLTSITATDGLIEISDHTTALEPGTMVGFLPYVMLLG